MRSLTYLMLLILVLLLPSMTNASTPKAKNIGLVFVHGTRDHREDANGGYWKSDFIAKVVLGLPNPENYFVVHCDFSHYMWHEDSASCAAEQIETFITEKNINALIIYSHSNGGNVVRWILSNPTFNKSYLHIKNTTIKVIAVAPSSAGTSLADEVLEGNVLESSLAWLLGYLSDAVKQQRVGEMLLFNEELLLGTKGRPSLPTPFQVVVGTDVVASPFSSLSYCNGYFENTGLKLAKLYLDKCADGFLNCSSQIAAGDLWFYDKEKTDNNTPLGHNQSRHSCGGMDIIMIKALAAEGDEA